MMFTFLFVFLLRITITEHDHCIHIGLDPETGSGFLSLCHYHPNKHTLTHSLTHSKVDAQRLS